MHSMAASSGQPFVYAESEDTFPSNLICAVCHDVCGTHSACPGCQQTFCEVCVHKWFDVQRTTGTNCTCPYCRRKLRFSDLTHDPTIQQQLDQLSVLCPNAPAGCAAVMARADLPAHLQHSCMHEAVSCRFCGQAGLRSDIQQHESSSCRKRLVPCQHAAAGCDAMVPLDDMLQHVELNCSFTCKPCPQCKTAVPRCAWSAHLQNSCPAQQPCHMHLYGCSFEGDAAAVAVHSSSCAYKQNKQQLQQRLGLQTGRDAVSTAGGTATASSTAAGAETGLTDCGELPACCVPDAAAAFQASTSRSSDCQVRQCLLDSLPQTANSVLPPRLHHHHHQQQQQAGGVTLPGLAAGNVSIKQLASISPPKVFTVAAGPPGEPKTSHDAAEQERKQTISSGTSRLGGSDSINGSSGSGRSSSMRSAVEQLALGAPGCLSGVGLQPDPLLECAWRIIVNMAVVQVFKVQETAVDQQLSAFILYSSINRAWDTVLDFINTLPTAFEEQGNQQGQQQHQQQGQQRQQQHQQQQQAQPFVAAQPPQAPALPTPQQQQLLQQQQRLLQQLQQQQERPATGGTGFISAALSSLFGGRTASNGSSNAQPTAPQAPLLFQPAPPLQLVQQQWALQQLQQAQQQQQQPQQQQARPQLTGRQIWERMLGGGNSDPQQQQQQQQQGQPGSRGSNDGSSSSSSGSSREAYTFQDDGIPGLQRGLYEEEYTDIEWWLVKTIPGRQLMSTVAAAAYSLCLWLSIGGPCFAAHAVEGEGVSQLSQLASYRVGTLMVKLLQRAVKYQQREGRKKGRGQNEGRETSDSEWRPRDPQREAFLEELQAEDEARQSAAAAGAGATSSGSSAAPLMIAVHGLGTNQSMLPPRGNRDGSSGGSGQQQQQQQRGRGGRSQDESWQAFSQLMREAAATDPAHTEERMRMERQLQQLTQQYEGLSASGLGTPLLTMPGEPYWVIKQRLQAIACDGLSVPEHKHIPPWLRGLRPLVALELGSALLLLHDVRADQCELSLIPGVNTHMQHGYRGYWALSVLAGVQSWLGPGFKLSWQALAVLNDMVVLQVNNLCQVLGDSFYDPVQQRVPMSPALALEAARLVVPPGLLSECLPHLLRLSATYRDVSCEDLSDATWEQLSRKLGLVAELDKLASLVNELLPVTFMEDEDDSSDDYDEDTDSDGDMSSAFHDDTDEDSESESESTAGSYETDYEEGESSSNEYQQSDGTSSDSDSAGSDSGSSSDGSSESRSGGNGRDRDLAVYEKWLRFGAGLRRRPSIERGVAARSGSTPASPAAAAAGGASSSRSPAAAAAAGAGTSSGAGGSNKGGTGVTKGSGRGHGRGGTDSGSGGSDSDSSSSSGEWESADEAEAAELEQELLAERSVGTPRGGSESDTSLSSWARPAAAAAAVGAVADAGGSGSGVGVGSSLPPAKGGKNKGKKGDYSPALVAGVGCAGSGSCQPGSSASAAQADAEDCAGVSSGASSDNLDWRQQWASNLQDLSKTAAAGTNAAAPEASSQQQQQREVAAGACLSPYAAQLLQQACEVARKQPDQLLLEGSLTPADPPPGASTGGATAGTSDSPAAGTSSAAAGTSDGTAAAQPAVQESGDAAFAAAPSAAALYLRSATLPAADIMAQLAAVHGDSTATASGTSGAGGTAAAGGTASAGGDGGAGSSTAAAAAAGATGANGTAPAEESNERPRRYFMTAPATGAIRERRRREGRERPGEDGEPGDACTHGVVLLLGLIEVVLKKLLQQAGRAAAADPEVLGISSRSSGGASGSGRSRKSGEAGEVRGVSEGGVGDSEVLLLQSVQPRVVITAKHVQLAVARDEDLSKILLQDWPGAPVDCSVCWAGGAPDIDPKLLPDPASEPITAFLLHLAQGSLQQQAQQGNEQLGPTTSSSSSSGSSQAIVFPADLCMYCGVTVSMSPAAIPSERKPSEAYGPGQAAEAAGATSSPAGAAAAAATTAAECEGPSATCCFMSGWQCSACAAQTADLAAAGLEAQLQACRQGLDRAMSVIAQQQQEQAEQRELAALTDEQLQQLMTATRLFHLQQPGWFDSSTADGNKSMETPSSSRIGSKLSAVGPVGLSQNQGPWDAVDKVQLQQMEPLLQPLRDIVALREAHLQQQQSKLALPSELFDQMVQDAVCDVMSKRQQHKQQEEQVREQLRRLMGPSAGSSAAAAAAAAAADGSGGAAALRSPAPPLASSGSPARTPGRGRAVNIGGPGAPSSSAAAAVGSGVTATSATDGSGVDGEVECELTMQADAMQLLQQAAEDFLVQQLAGANRLALHAGRQEVGPQDLRLALQTSGYGHLLQGLGRNSRVATGTGSAAGASFSRAGVGSSKKGRRGLGAGFFMS